MAWDLVKHWDNFIQISSCTLDFTNVKQPIVAVGVAGLNPGRETAVLT
jgi:hypothetical protein